MKANNKNTQAAITSEKGLQLLKEGNLRFQNSERNPQDFEQQVASSSEGQFPFATILSCIDSRVPPEIIFDQGIGDIFSIRMAGNFADEDVLGSMEFGAKLAGAKLIVVLGHTGCGAVKGACDDVELGNLTALISKIKPAVESTKEPEDVSVRNSENLDFVNKVAAKNVGLTIDKIRKDSKILCEMEREGKIKIMGAMYDVATGKVDFIES